MTITEALAELKTLAKRLATKREYVLTHLTRDERLRDPLEGEGGSIELLKRERQAIKDLEERIIAIRAAIAQVNGRTTITIKGVTRSITEWLAWRRDVSQLEGQFLRAMRQVIDQARKEQSPMARRQAQLGAMNVLQSQSGGEQKPANTIVNVNEQELARQSEDFEEILGQLDGQLALKNATTEIRV